MKRIIRILFSSLFCILLSFALQAQEKKNYPEWRDLTQSQRQYYYFDNPSAILPDAQKAFDKGDYSLCLMLCSMHFNKYGDSTREKDKKNVLQNTAEKCFDLVQEMNVLLSNEQIDAAKKKAADIIKLNPKDSAAQDVLNREVTPNREAIPITQYTPTPVRKPISVSGVELASKSQTMTVGKSYKLAAKVFPENADDKSVSWSSTAPSIAKVSPDGVVTALKPGTVTITVTTNDGSWTSTCTIIINSEQQTIQVAQTPSKESKKPESKKNTKRVPHTAFVVKGGARILHFPISSQGINRYSISPELGIGVIDIGGSRLGAEIDGSYGSGMIGIDASAIVRITPHLYLRPLVGFFSYSPVMGLTGGLGLQFIIGPHFCIDVGAKYLPEIRISSNENISTAGTTYEFPNVAIARDASIGLSLKIGWAF